MASVYKRGKTWIASFKGENGLWQSKAAGTDKTAALELARREETLAMRRREGMIDPAEERFASQSKRTMAEHIADFTADMRAKGASAKHYKLTEQRILRVLDLAKVQAIADFQSSSINTALGMLRNGLEVDGVGIVAQVSKASTMHYTRAIKMFSRWLERDNRARGDVLKRLKVGTVQKSERVRVRRALSVAEFEQLISYTATAGTLEGITGADRAILYRLAAGSGLRASELGSLTPESFDLEAGVVTLKAAYSKRKRDDRQPLPIDLVSLLGNWIEGKAKGARVFNMPPTKHTTSIIFSADLMAARSAWIAMAAGAERIKREDSDFLKTPDSEDRVIDFHALRHSYVSWLVNSGAPVSVCQSLARHSTPTLTLGIYTHIRLADTSKALEALPMPTTKPEGQPEA